MHILLFLSVLAFFILIAIHLNSRNKINKLLEATKKIAEDKDVRTSIASQDKFGQLGSAINAMADSLSLESDFHKHAIDQHSIVAITDVSGVITYVNDKFCEISQYSREELIGSNHNILNSGIHPKSFFAEMWQIISSGQTWHGEICNRKKDGSIYFVETTILPHMDKNNLPDRYISIRTDITTQVTAQKKLKQDKEFLNALLQHLNEGIIACDAKGKLTLFNEAIRKFFNLPKTDIPPQEWAEHYHLYKPDGVTPMQMEDIPLIRALNGNHIYNVKMVVKPEGKAPVTLLTNGQALYDEHNNKLGAVISALNITDQKN